MTKIKIPFLLALTLLLAACQSLGVPQADTFNKRVVVANGVVESVADTITVLVTTEKISRPEARQYLDRARESAALIDAVVQLKGVNPAEADMRLAAIIAGLNLLKAELETRRE